MSTHNSLVVDRDQMHTVHPAPWLRGFANLLRKEHSLWWDTRKWLIHLVLWPLFLNGLVVVVASSLALEPAHTAVDIATMVTMLFFLVAAQAAGFGAVVATQSAVVGEKQRGTAAWILSKPVSRSAFVLAKLVAQALAFLSLAVVLPSTIFYAQSVLLWGALPDPTVFVGAVLLVMLHVLFYLSLTLASGTFFRGSGPVAGVAVGALLLGLAAQDHVGRLADVLPWKLPVLAGLVATHESVAKVLPVTVIAVITSIGLLVAAALWRFKREEF